MITLLESSYDYTTQLHVLTDVITDISWPFGRC